ncbi:MAG: septal ring lytic transglycosylase RlpA family protein [Dactylosporangium sp.]|nr:septal ring lytic transglycosylase RlpA family protein [Dactylosporangium sp.]NNJ61582.1 septal ring lytic transglycosylase RlpA family protein [Dactylosporangium sp.]
MRALAGRHSAQPSPDEDHGPKPSRRLFPVLAGAAVAAVLVGGAVAALRFEGGGDDTGGVAAPASTRTVDLDEDATRSPDRADRNELREAIQLPPSLAPSPSAKPSASPSSTVKSSGTCKASYYATGTTTANGEAFDPDGLTAAHKTLPFNTRVRVTNLANSTSVTARINDRGPFVEGRCIDLSRGAFKAIASLGAGVITVKYEVLA